MHCSQYPLIAAYVDISYSVSPNLACNDVVSESQTFNQCPAQRPSGVWNGTETDKQACLACFRVLNPTCTRTLKQNWKAGVLKIARHQKLDSTWVYKALTQIELSMVGPRLGRAKPRWRGWDGWGAALLRLHVRAGYTGVDLSGTIQWAACYDPHTLLNEYFNLKSLPKLKGEKKSLCYLHSYDPVSFRVLLKPSATVSCQSPRFWPSGHSLQESAIAPESSGSHSLRTQSRTEHRGPSRPRQMAEAAGECPRRPTWAGALKVVQLLSLKWISKTSGASIIIHFRIRYKFTSEFSSFTSGLIV